MKSQRLAYPWEIGIGSVGGRDTQNAIVNLPKSGEPIGIGGRLIGKSVTAIGSISNLATLAVLPSANNLFAESGVLSVARRHQQTQNQNYERVFHGALDAA